MQKILPPTRGNSLLDLALTGEDEFLTEQGAKIMA